MSVDAAPQRRDVDDGVLAPGVPFAANLAQYGERTALIDAYGRRLTYRELADRVADMRAWLGTTRRLVLVAAANDIHPIVAYLAALADGHPVLLTSADDAEYREELLESYDPDVVIDGEFAERRAGTAHTLHPELALLLSTSGSTGSPKLVRLSARNVQANAESIARYLEIEPTDRAITSLPMQYCYGLSVINSNLLRGASLVLTDTSVIEPEFWTLFREHGCTSLHGVPYTFDLLDRAGFADMELPTLRYVTQAGGRLAPERVREFARLGRRSGWRLFVMYGQTEATARMAYLPPELAERHPDAIGVAIPDGDFELAPVPGSAASTAVADGVADTTDQGELIYRGPNVMLGYAESPADLAEGRTVTALATGDLARRTPDGLYVVTGRASRFVKVCGLRIDLDHVERLCADRDITALCTGHDDRLLLAVSVADDVGVAAELVTSRLGLPAAAVRVGVLAETPRLTSGKVDYAAVAAAVAASASGTADGEGAPAASGVREIFADVLPRYTPDDIGDDDSFVTLGGDSLSYVRASVALEKLLGELPATWPSMPVGELERLRPRRRVLAALETNILLRAVAIVLVVGSHVGLFHILGGAHLLLVLAGWSFARFCLGPGVANGFSGTADAATNPSRAILRSTAHIAIPSVAWLAWRALATDDVGWDNVVLLNNYLGISSANGYWFVEVLVQTLLLLSVLFAIPAVRRFERSQPFLLPLAVLAVSLTGRLFISDMAHFFEWALATHTMLWFFALGWLGFRARTWSQRLVVVAAAVLTISGFFDNAVREGIVLVGLVLVLFLPRVRIPRVLLAPVGLIASASLYIYLTHYVLLPGMLAVASPLVVTASGIALGIAVWFAVERGTVIGARLWRNKRTARHRHGDGPSYEVSVRVRQG
ncbi:AMP-binding protein [Haloechinothrix halophila]|uniref:AMP-binding protein n=1 Tax=Haloechinothrix halophila TaxID=1069073 RepID=UPI0003FE01B4|nr:AMP-binding protein [Haloechinothrix halophila]